MTHWDAGRHVRRTWFLFFFFFLFSGGPSYYSVVPSPSIQNSSISIFETWDWERERERDVIDGSERSTSAVGGETLRADGAGPARSTSRLLRFDRRRLRHRRRHVPRSYSLSLSLFPFLIRCILNTKSLMDWMISSTSCARGLRSYSVPNHWSTWRALKTTSNRSPWPWW